VLIVNCKKKWWKTPKAFKLQQKTLRVANQLGNQTKWGKKIKSTCMAVTKT
jgi:hypothetical protein